MSGDLGAPAIAVPGGLPARVARALRAGVASPFARKVAETFGARITVIAVGLVTSVLVARALGPEGRGLCAVAAAFGALGAQFGNLGLHASNTYVVARDRSRLPQVLGNSFVASGATAGLAVVAWAVFAAWPAAAPVHGPLLALALATIPAGLAAMLVGNLLLGIGDVRAYNAMEVVSRVATTAVLTVLVLVGLATPATLVGAGLVALVGSVVWGTARLRPHLGAPPTASGRLFLEQLRYGLRAYVGALLGFLVLRTDLFLVRYLLGVDAAGQYSVATAMAELLCVLPIVVGTLLFPHLSALPDPSHRRRTARRAAMVAGAGMTAVALVAAVAAGPVVRLLYGEPFAPAAPAFVALLPGVVALSINAVLMNYFAAEGMPPVSIYGPAVGALAGAGAGLVLVPRLGLVGGALGSSAAYATWLAASLLEVRRTRAGQRPAA